MSRIFCCTEPVSSLSTLFILHVTASMSQRLRHKSYLNDTLCMNTKHSVANLCRRGDTSQANYRKIYVIGVIMTPYAML